MTQPTTSQSCLKHGTFPGDGAFACQNPCPSTCDWGHALSRHRSAFTLVELLVSLAIITTLISIGAFAFRDVRDSRALALAKNAILTYSAVARNYAIAQHIETMMVVNPFNGRFEIWYLNPPADGGLWDPLSSGDSTTPSLTDGYAFAPVLDRSSSLPLDGSGRPLAVVNPIDFDDPAYRPTLDNPQNIDNLTWTAFCFDENGKLVIRTRRIATRTFRFRDRTPRNPSERNRLEEESPDLSLLASGPLVDVRDTAITSTRGFIISERRKMIPTLGSNPSPADLVTRWLSQTRPGGRFFKFAQTVVLDRFSGRQLAGDF